MLDIQACRDEFLKYVSNFNSTEDIVTRKISHTLRVADISYEIADELKLEQEEKELAYIIGILHDIGRFRQIMTYHTYSDQKSNVSHSKLGVEVLFDENKIVDFIDVRKYDSIIKTAILNHSTLYIEDGLNEKELLFSKIIRDADKLDIFDMFTKDDLIEMGIDSGFEDSNNYSNEVLNAFLDNRQVSRNYHKYLLDWFINAISFVYDINFKESLIILQKEKYMSRIIERMIEIKSNNENVVEMLDKINKHIDSYIDNKVNN